MANLDLKTLVEKEQRTGYLDAAVFGGFSTFLLERAKTVKNSDLERLAMEYQKASLVDRADILKEIAVLSATLPATSRVFEEGKIKGGRSTANPTYINNAASLAMPIQYMKNIGPRRAALFKRMEVNTVGDLLFFFPRDYKDLRDVSKIRDLRIGDRGIIAGEIVEAQLQDIRPRLSIIKALIRDKSGMIPAIWFNQKFLLKQLEPGKRILLQGKMDYRYKSLQFSVTDYEFLDDEIKPRIVPVYRSTESLNQKLLRNTVSLALDKYGNLLEEILPVDLVAKRHLMPRKEAVRELHFPSTFEEKEQARCRMAYEEFLILELAILKSQENLYEQGIVHGPLGEKWQVFLNALPFSLTKAQVRVIDEVFSDMDKPEAMARLVQGDVGSGKTMVAAAALYKTCMSSHQGVLMVPTEILAGQHYQSLGQLFQKLGLKTALFTGSLTGKGRKELLEQVKNGEIDILIGTHTVIQEGVEFSSLGLCITDEQHRFGVRQRAELKNKGVSPDVLVMTATPIPRSLALTLYGDLKLSVIDELPPGRKLIKTYAVNYEYEARINNFLEKEMKAGRQIFIVCPLVEESEKIDLESALELAEHLKRDVFKKRRVGILHGKMKSKEKDDMMERFRKKEIDILVSTTVIEVGINIPNATVMVVRDAERFGLAQLHQLRGRIGRGSKQSYCILMHNAKSEVARERMQIMSESADGFKIAEADLRLRGPGEFWGTRQHGIPLLKVANLFSDHLLLEQAREDALTLLSRDIDFNGQEFILLKKYLDEKMQFLN